jgi:hypothetical protein
MYFDGQLHYLDKDNKSGPKQQQQQQQPQAPLPAPAAAASHARAHTADPFTSSAPSQASALHNNNSPSLSTPAPPTMPNSSLPKSQTVGGTAGDLHSMALKSAINNIGTSLPFPSRNCPPANASSSSFHQTPVPSETDVVCRQSCRAITDNTFTRRHFLSRHHVPPRRTPLRYPRNRRLGTQSLPGLQSQSARVLDINCPEKGLEITFPSSQIVKGCRAVDRTAAVTEGTRFFASRSGNHHH